MGNILQKNYQKINTKNIFMNFETTAIFSVYLYI